MIGVLNIEAIYFQSGIKKKFTTKNTNAISYMKMYIWMEHTENQVDCVSS